MQSTNPFYATAAALVSVILIGWLLMIGQSLIVPVIIAVISVYLLSAASTGLASVLPSLRDYHRLRSLIVLAIFVLFVVLFALFVSDNALAIAASLPTYADNLNTLIDNLANTLGLTEVPSVATLLERPQERIDVGALVQSAVGTVSGIGSVLVMAICYAVFLAADLKTMPGKLRIALGDETSAEQTVKLVMKVNKRIGGYLIAKTLVNGILAAVSFVIMWLLGIEFALLWAVLIGLFNYIPYVGSIIGVVFPVLLSLGQFGSLAASGAALIALMTAQLYVGYVLEPKMLGKSVNLSAFVVLLALSFWTLLWGAIGAILAVPLTAVVMIILAEIPSLRPVAVLISDDGEV
ncbi:AI-2E family transporter [Cognatiyoonia sp. IB215446]|uniref:AI-2E family transporter n=1 Tax=Cognatiyoonia sp. IB215446 TaxID=3097355 RepID=UPI002A12B2C2|nr:AI-2E family transporter [Cognatiyoonia sp. IB215446]MDX8350049.1 AI-2E family transporter [Cognatiyoonia sp. IB215446]